MTTCRCIECDVWQWQRTREDERKAEGKREGREKGRGTGKERKGDTIGDRKMGCMTMKRSHTHKYLIFKLFIVHLLHLQTIWLKRGRWTYSNSSSRRSKDGYKVNTEPRWNYKMEGRNWRGNRKRSSRKKMYRRELGSPIRARQKNTKEQ